MYSPRHFDADGLVPTARALLALLEDARVEALAMRELPGLARLWRPLHTATPDSGRGCEALMARLFYLDEALGLPALRTPAELRTAAMRLGHDIGQQRLPFNARGYRPAPGYRDDSRWMWPADRLAEVQPPPTPQPTPADALQAADDDPQPLPGSVTLHPEWDRLIQRLRPAWARVIERAAPAVPTQAGTVAAPPLTDTRLLAPLSRLARPLAPRGRAAEGERFHADALLAWAIARRCGQPGDIRVYRARQHQAARAAVWLLVDQSASTAAPLSPAAGPRGNTVLHAAGQAAQATAQALQALGVPCAVAAFHSNGRHAVRLRVLQPLGHAADGQLAHRLQALRPAGSTRLGAALRHATLRLGAGRTDARWVLLISDGQPHDVDMHTPQDLVDDARHAVQAARRRGVRMACLTLAASAGPEALRIFGRAGTQALDDLQALPRALRRLLA